MHRKTWKKWTQQEIERLEKMWPTTTTAELAQKFKRSEKAITKMAYLLQLGPKTAATDYMSLRALLNTILGYRICQSDADWPDNILVVYLSASQSFVQNNTTIEVEGVLEIGSHRDGDTGFISQLRLRDARFRTL